MSDSSTGMLIICDVLERAKTALRHRALGMELSLDEQQAIIAAEFLGKIAPNVVAQHTNGWAKFTSSVKAFIYG